MKMNNKKVCKAIKAIYEKVNKTLYMNIFDIV